MKKTTHIFVAIVFFISFMTAGMLGSVLNAQNSDQITLGISPQLLDLTANPGDVLENTFRLTNGSDVPVEIVVTPKNFSPRGEEGAVNLTEESTAFSLAQWIDVSPEKTTIDAKKTADFRMKINVPENAEPGSHFGSVVFRTVPPEQEGNAAAVSQEVAPVILVKIAGNTTESAEVEEFKSTNEFYTNEDTVTFLSRIKNTGNVHFQPTGKIVVKDMFGKQVAELELDKKNVLPDSIRAISTDWRTDGFKFGRYTAELTLVYGKDSSIKTASTTFTVFPYQTILPWVLAVVLVGFIIVKFRKRIVLAFKVLSGKNPEE